MGRNASGGGGSRARAAAANFGAITARAQARAQAFSTGERTRARQSARRGGGGAFTNFDTSFGRNQRVSVTRTNSLGRTVRGGRFVADTSRSRARGGVVTPRQRRARQRAVANRRAQARVGRQLAAGQMTFLDL